jgi:glutamate 5-kinase
MKRLLIKVGTNLIADNKRIKSKFLDSFVDQIIKLYKKDHEIIIVSSGAIGLSLKTLKLKQKPGDVCKKQAAAAIGQIILMDEYKRRFNSSKINIAQILLTYDVIKNRKMRQNAINTLLQLLEWKTIPIINENDTVATEEIKFGDNDILAGIVGKMLCVDLVIILTSVGGIYNKNPNEYGAKIIKEIYDINNLKIKTYGLTENGTGGIKSKIECAKILKSSKIPLVIANGNKKDILIDIINGKKEGTVIK